MALRRISTKNGCGRPHRAICVDSTDPAVVVELGPLHVDVIIRRNEAGFPKRAATNGSRRPDQLVGACVRTWS
jgi:hypothetical protein